MRSGFIGLVAGWLWLSTSAVAQDAGQMLEQLRHKQTENYQGSFIYERKDVFSTHSMWRSLDEQGRKQERFLQLSGPRLEVLRVDGQVVCAVRPNAEQALTAQTWPDKSLDWQRLAKWYRLEVLGQGRVADRTTVAVLFTPRDAHRYPLELHLDKQTAVPLKSLLLNEQGQLLERFQFVTYSAGQVSAQDMQVNPDTCSEQLEPQETSEQPRTWQWQLDWLPEGFAPVTQNSDNWSISQQQVIKQNYSDGLAHFSVFVESVESQQVSAARLQLGPTAVITRRIETEFGAFMLTVLGEIPAGTAERLALSVRVLAQELEP